MDSTGPLDGGVHDKTGRYSYLPSPHFSGTRDSEIISTTASDDLMYRYGGHHHRQNSIQNSYSINLHDRAKDFEITKFQRIPYSPESLPSDYRNSDPNHTGTKIGSASPNHRVKNTAAFLAVNDNSGSHSYLPTSFTGDKEVNCTRLSPSRQVNPRNRFHPYSPEFSRSHTENTLNGTIGYNERMLQGNLHQKELPRTVTNEGDYLHGAPLSHGRSADGHRDSGVSWSSRSWLTSPSSDLQAPLYPSTYTAFSTSPHLEASYVTAPYGSATHIPDGGLSQRGSSPGQRHSARSHSLETLSSSPHPNAIHCPLCTQTFPTAEQYTKHQQKHQKMYRCRFDNCTRTEGFATPNDRERHEKSVHKIAGFYWRCLDPNCSSFRKEFARRDNLKDHLKRMHTMPPGVDEQEANAWRNQMADSGKYEKPDTSRALR